MSQYILFNDQFFNSDAAMLQATNRAFKFGDGFFETMRMCNGKLRFPELHADRIKATMKALKMDGYNLLDDYFLKQKTAELARKNKIGGNARFRLTIYRQGEGLYTPETNKVGYLLEVKPLESSGYELNKKGIIVDVYDEIAKPINKLSNYKTTNALPFVMAAIYQKQHRLDEVLVLNQNGFFVRKYQLKPICSLPEPNLHARTFRRLRWRCNAKCGNATCQKTSIGFN